MSSFKRQRPVPASHMIGSFNTHYALSFSNDPSIGLTDIPWQKMTKVIGPGDDDSRSFFDLGFEFWFDGKSYCRAEVCVNGWILLQDSADTYDFLDYMKNTKKGICINNVFYDYERVEEFLKLLDEED